MDSSVSVTLLLKLKPNCIKHKIYLYVWAQGGVASLAELNGIDLLMLFSKLDHLTNVNNICLSVKRSSLQTAGVNLILKVLCD